MTRETWVSVRFAAVVAALMAIAAFAIGQVEEGAGVIFLMITMPIWIAYNVGRERRLRRSAG